jgi:intein/homing endonuclease
LNEDIGTIISNTEGPSPSLLSFVVNKGKIHKGQFVEVEYSQGTLVALVINLMKTNRYFERSESVKEFEQQGRKLFEQFPVGEWEYLEAHARPLGVYKDKKITRPSFPPAPGDKVRVASNELLSKFLKFDNEKGLELGEIDFHGLPVKPGLGKLIQKHLSILAISGAGKCLAGDTKIFLEGLKQKTISELVDSVLIKNKRVEDGVEFWEFNSGLKTYSMGNGLIQPGKIFGFYRRKSPKKLVSVKTRSGRVLKLTFEHMVPFFDGGIEWVCAKELSVGQHLIFPRINWVGKETTMEFFKELSGLSNFTFEGNFVRSKISKKKVALSYTVDEKFARLWAYLLAEGHYNNKSRVIFINNAPEVSADFLGLVKEKFGIIPTPTARKGEYYFDNKILAYCLSRKGLTSSSWTKSIPEELLSSNREVLLAFLSAFIDCDGFINTKKSELEITLASKKLSEGIQEILSKLGVVSFCRVKKVKGKFYPRIFVRSEELKKLNGLSLKIPYKQSAFEKWLCHSSNTNVDLFPGVSSALKEIFNILKVSYSSFGQVMLNYSSTARKPSRNSLSNVLNFLDNRVNHLENTIMEIGQFSSLDPSNQSKTELNQNLSKIKTACEFLGFSSPEFCISSGVHNRYLYEHSTGKGMPSVSTVVVLNKRLYSLIKKSESDIKHAKQKISKLKDALALNSFFDEIKSIEIINSDSEYVYDLSVENSNFIANNLIVHNSYFTSCLFEELLDRKKEHGRIATVVLDTHGEYVSFVQKNPSGTDYSTRTKLINARDLKIGVSGLSAGMICSFIPKSTPQQKRELEKAIMYLRREMKEGLGPFDFEDIKRVLVKDEEINEKTQKALLSWIDSLNSMGLFSKTDSVSLESLVKPGILTVVNLGSIIDLQKKQIIVTYFANKLFNERLANRFPPFLLVLEEAHQYCPEGASREQAISRSIIEKIAREGRKFGASLCLISQRPIQLSTTALSQCNSNVILRITNPYDLEHIGKSCEGLDKPSLDMITSLQVGEALIIGEAVGFPVFFKVRKRRSAESNHELSLEDFSRRFEEERDEAAAEAREFL